MITNCEDMCACICMISVGSISVMFANLWSCKIILCITNNCLYDTGRYPLGILIGIRPGDPPTVLNRVDCRGTERNITECTHVFNGDCLRSGAGVICPVLNGLL